MNTEQPTILPWHREAAQDIGDQLSQWGNAARAALRAIGIVPPKKGRK